VNARVIRSLGVALAALTMLAAAPAAAPGADSAAPAVRRTTVNEVSEGLTCQCGCGLTVANCNHPSCNFSVPLRGELDGMVRSGMSREAILASFRKKYGEKILSAPTTEGFNILAWTAPFAALLAGAAFIVLTLGRWRSPAAPAAPASEPAPGPPAQFAPRFREALERELKERL
jgi:cytochrome c-type biogenesis protein CcmH